MDSAEKAEIEQEFRKALTRARLMLSKKLLTKPEVCDLYGHFQQATVGDCNDWKVFGNFMTGMLDLDSKTKYKAWQTNQGLKPVEAMQRYITAVDLLGTKYSVVFPSSMGSRFGSVTSLSTQTTGLPEDDNVSVSALDLQFN